MTARARACVRQGGMSGFGKSIVLMAAGSCLTLLVCAGLVLGRAGLLGEDALFY